MNQTGSRDSFSISSFASMAEESESRYISLEELGKHNAVGDLWISIDGKVYDVSDWVKDHPGGELPLLSLAGQEVTDTFLAYHPRSAWRYLGKFFTGFYLKDFSTSEASDDYRKLVAEFSKLGLFEKKGYVTIFTLMTMVVLFSVSIYEVLCSDSTLMHLASGGLLGFVWIQSGWIGHDCCHYQVMNSSRFNRFSQLLFGNYLTGISVAWWKWSHNAHHISCNSLDFDPDMQHMSFLVLSSKNFSSLTSFFDDRKMEFDYVSRFFVSQQHWTFYLVVCFARVSLLAQSILLLLSRRRVVANRGREILGILVFWIWYPLLVSCLPNLRERTLFVISCFAVTGIQHLQFCLNHFSSTVYIGPPIGNNWVEKQTHGTLDISCPPWMDWFHGGLQFQIEHHLFPRMPRCQLRKMSPLVKELCIKHNLPYDCVSFWTANLRTLKTLYSAALQARDLGNLVPKNFVWEALNTHG